MTSRQFLWGLSGGVAAFAVAGTFWFGFGLSRTFSSATPWWWWALANLAQAASFLGLLWAAYRLRRRSGFRRADLRHGTELEQAETARIRFALGWTVLGQAIVIALAVWWCVHTHVEARIWPCIGFAVSLHLLPLARIFHVRAYYVTAVAGTIISTWAFARAPYPDAVPVLGCALAVIFWASAVYLLLNADRIATRAVRERWSL